MLSGELRISDHQNQGTNAKHVGGFDLKINFVLFAVFQKVLSGRIWNLGAIHSFHRECSSALLQTRANLVYWLRFYDNLKIF